MEFRTAVEVEWRQLAQLRWDFQSEDARAHSSEYPEFLREFLVFLKSGPETGDWTYWIAVQNHEVISQIFVHTIRAVPRPQRLAGFYGYMTNVYTKPPYRNQGIGTKLLWRVIEWARTEGVQLLFVSPSGLSVPFYKRAGFHGETDWMNLEVK